MGSLGPCRCGQSSILFPPLLRRSLSPRHSRWPTSVVRALRIALFHFVDQSAVSYLDPSASSRSVLSGLVKRTSSSPRQCSIGSPRGAHRFDFHTRPVHARHTLFSHSHTL